MVAPSPTTGEGAYLLGIGTPINVLQSRRVTSIEGGIGLRAQFALGAAVLVPGVEFAYQRLKAQDDASLQSINGPYASSLTMNTYYYQLAASLALIMPIAPQLYLVGSGRTSFDLAHANLDGSSAFTFSVGAPDSATASASDSFISNHTTLQAGFVIVPNPIWSVSILGIAEYISKVPGAVFPIYNLAAPGAVPLNGITSIQVGDYQASTTYGVSVSALASF